MVSNMKPLNQFSAENERSKTLSSADGNDQKKQLFKGAVENEKGKGNEPVSKTSQGTSATMATMNETKDRLLERGEKLSQLQDKTGDLANQASEFARLAKQLNEQQKSRWF
jgi:hypothetical protein